jgi:hypothetical protein
MKYIFIFKFCWLISYLLNKLFIYCFLFYLLFFILFFVFYCILNVTYFSLCARCNSPLPCRSVISGDASRPPGLDRAAQSTPPGLAPPPPQAAPEF